MSKKWNRWRKCVDRVGDCDGGDIVDESDIVNGDEVVDVNTFHIYEQQNNINSKYNKEAEEGIDSDDLVDGNDEIDCSQRR